LTARRIPEGYLKNRRHKIGSAGLYCLDRTGKIVSESELVLPLQETTENIQRFSWPGHGVWLKHCQWRTKLVLGFEHIPSYAKTFKKHSAI
tara:strand:+ start:938 stop:1210 length:273 start_codon:yes stop_codon:yes gene_type:complete